MDISMRIQTELKEKRINRSNQRRSFSRKRFVKRVANFFMIHGIVTALLCLIVPVSIFTQLTYYFYAVIFIQEALVLYVVIKGAIDGERGALGYIFAGVITVLCVTRDMLSGAAVIASYSEIVIVGFVLMIVAIGLNILFYIEQGRTEMANSKLYKQAYLNATIKPHFLFNTLNMISGIIEIDKEKAKNLVQSLSDLLRNVVSQDSLASAVMLEKELQVAKEYANIQMSRFDRLSVNFEFKDSDGVKLPFFGLQPLIENSIKHCFSGESDERHIMVCGSLAGDNYRISVIDDGVGIEPKLLTEIEERLISGEVNKEVNSIGLYNVNERLMTLYKKRLKITSVEGKGTTVVFEVPKDE